MDLWLFILIVLATVILFGFLFKNVFQQKTSTEILLLGVLLVITGGFLLTQPVLPIDIFLTLVGLGLIFFGFFVGVIGFFKV